MKKNPVSLAMKKLIVDYKKINQTVLNLLVDKYPDGYDDRDIISFRNALGERIDCVEVRSVDTVYLVKVSKRLELAMDAFESEDDMDVDQDFNAMESDRAVLAFEE